MPHAALFAVFHFAGRMLFRFVFVAEVRWIGVLRLLGYAFPLFFSFYHLCFPGVIVFHFLVERDVTTLYG